MHIYTAQSSNIASFGWDNAVLYIQFHNGSVYSYADVPREVFVSMTLAESTGKFFHAAIRKSYVATQMAPADAARLGFGSLTQAA